MTFRASSPSPKSFSNVAALWLGRFLLLGALASCAHIEDKGTKHRHPDANSSRFEWAVQNFEAGNFKKAIESFRALRAEGSALSGYDLIPYYLGMSHFRLKQYEPAARELESFVRGGGNRQESQDARITLLLAYEKLARWKDASSLAAETDKLTLFQNSRALLKLVWARSLREQNELLGAKATLEDTLPYLDKVGFDDGSQPFYADPDQDLWGRYHYTALLIAESECAQLGPHETLVPLPPLKDPEKTARKRKPIVRRLYPPWIESVTDCQRKAVTRASEEIFFRDSPWSEPTRQVLADGIDAFGAKLRSFLKQESGVLSRERALQKTARENLYRLLATIEEKMKYFKDHGLSPKTLESLRKQVDPLLVSISTSS